MGIFGDFMATKHRADCDTRALVSSLCMSICSDGEVTDEEVDHALSIAMELPGVRGHGQEEVEGLLEEAFQALQQHGLDVCMVEVARALPDPQTREEAFALAALIQYADGKITEGEDDFLAAFRDVLEIESARADAILA